MDLHWMDPHPMDSPSFQTPPPHLEALGSLLPSLPCMEMTSFSLRKKVRDLSFCLSTLNTFVCTCTRSPTQILSTDCMYQVPYVPGTCTQWQSIQVLAEQPPPHPKAKKLKPAGPLQHMFNNCTSPEV